MEDRSSIAGGIPRGMWLFTKYGFFSVVAHRDVPGDLLIRARARKDLKAVAGLFGTELEGYPPAIEESPLADYPYRMRVARSTFARLVAHFVETLDYDNFKNEVAKTDAYRACAYHDVWETLITLEAPETAERSDPIPHRRPRRLPR